MGKQLSLVRVFDKIGYEPHVGQYRIHEAKATARFRVVCAGRRTGKSFSGGHELTAHAFEAYLKQDQLDRYTNRMEYWIVGPEYSDAEKEFRVVYSDLEKQGFEFDRPGTYYDAIGGNMHISLFEGKFQIHCKSAKYPDQLVGEGLDGVILAEAAKLRPSIWPKYIRPMLVDKRGWALMTSTPEGKNWFYDAYMQAAKGLSEWWSIRMPSWTNDVLFPLGREDPEVASLGEGLTAEAFNQEIGADFSEFTGRVFKEFDEDMNCRPLSWDPDRDTYACVDYGWTNPMVWLTVQVDVWDNVYVIGEFYEQHYRVEEAAEEIKRRGLVTPDMRTFYPDPASPESTATLEQKLNLRAGSDTGGELTERLDLIRKWVGIDPKVKHLPYGHPERVPKLFVDPVKCPNFVREFGAYRYPDTKKEQNEPEAPRKKDDHTPEALGRFMRGFFGNKERARPTRQARSNLSSQPTTRQRSNKALGRRIRTKSTL